MNAFVISMFLQELALYYVCVIPAYQRKCYQTHSTWRKGMKEPPSEQKEQDKVYEDARYQFEIKKKQKDG